jgi:hypothetical protein
MNRRATATVLSIEFDGFSQKCLKNVARSLKVGENNAFVSIGVKMSEN